MSVKKLKTDPVTAYARRAVAGIAGVPDVDGRLLHELCVRHLRDLKEGRATGRVWDPAAAYKLIEFMTEVLGVELSPPKQFLLGTCFGWRSARVSG